MTYIKLCLILLILLETGIQLYPLDSLRPKNPNTKELPTYSAYQGKRRGYFGTPQRFGLTFL